MRLCRRQVLWTQGPPGPTAASRDSEGDTVQGIALKIVSLFREHHSLECLNRFDLRKRQLEAALNAIHHWGLKAKKWEVAPRIGSQH